MPKPSSSAATRVGVWVCFLIDGRFADLPAADIHVIAQTSRSSTRLKIPQELLADALEDLSQRAG